MYIYSESKIKKSFLRNNTALNYFQVYLYIYIHLLKVLNFNQLIKRVFIKNIVNAFLRFYAESSGPEKYLLQSLVQEKNILCDTQNSDVVPCV